MIAGHAVAQIPDVAVHLDVRLNYRSTVGGDATLRYYDTLATPSTLSFSFNLEPGLKALVSQRLARIPGDGDRDQLDEYYVEDEGNWRVGKQFLPFGAGRLLHETAVAVRSDTSLFLQDFPIAVALCDAGPGRQRGVVGRIGNSRFGFSLAFGDHFGISASSFAVLRSPEESLGIGHGYRRALGVDSTQRTGTYALVAEFVALREGETEADYDTELFDARLILTPSRYRSVVLGVARDIRGHVDVERISGSFFVTRDVYLEPMVRFRNGKSFDFSLALRVRL